MGRLKTSNLFVSNREVWFTMIVINKNIYKARNNVLLDIFPEVLSLIKVFYTAELFVGLLNNFKLFINLHILKDKTVMNQKRIRLEYL